MSNFSNIFYRYLETLKEYEEGKRIFGNTWVTQEEVDRIEENFLKQLALALKEREKKNER